MNIDIAESLIESWLHVVKNCQIVQNKWTISTTWNMNNRDEINKRKEEINKLKKKKPILRDLLKKRELDTIFKQAECDTFGINYNDVDNIFYIVEIAFHEKGLHYNSWSEKEGKPVKIKDNSKVYKKLLIEGLIFYVYVAPFIKSENNTLKLIFTSPKANDLVNYISDSKYKQINEILNELYSNTLFKVNIEIIVNDDFKSKIYNEVIDTSKKNNINSELFMRSLKLINILNK